MKKLAKIIGVLMCLTLLISIIPFNAKAAPAGYTEFELVGGDVLAGVYKQGLNGPFDTKHYEAEYPETADILLPICMIDNDLQMSWWSKPIKFKDLHDEGGTWIPAVEVNLTRDGKPAKNIAGLTFWLRKLWDCEPTHFAIQVATDSAKTKWTTVYENEKIGDKEYEYVWLDYPMTFTFDPVDAYAIRFLAYNLADPNYVGDVDEQEYNNLVGDDTRFCCAEIKVFVYNGTDAPPTNAPTQKPTEKPTEPTQKPTQKPTEPTQKPTEKPTEPSQGGTTTTDPTGEPDPTDTVDPTDPTDTVDPTDPTGETDPTDTVDPTDPTGETDPTNAPTQAPTNAPEDDATQAPTNAPAATDKDDAADEPKSKVGLIIGIVAAVLVVAGGAAFLIIKKKKK